MEIALRRLTELAVHVKLASEAVLAAARHVAEMRPDEAPSDGEPWSRAMEDLVEMNVQLRFMERILRTLTREGVAAAPRGARIFTP
jgi:hypothetical protein